MTAQTTGERVTPKTVAELAAFVGECDRTRRKIAIEGGATLHGMGHLVDADVRLNTTGLKRLIAHEVADLTAAAEAGITLGALADALAAKGQFVPIDAPQRRHATLGGTLAAGWPGPRRHLYGRARDFVIGTQIVLADGTIASAGGMVVKNVTGYDMSKLYVGSFGTLGVLTRVNLKTLPLPQAIRAFISPIPRRARTRAFAQLQESTPVPSAAYWVEGFARSIEGEDADEGRLIVIWEGSETMLERATRDLRSLLGKAGVAQTRVIDVGARDVFERTLDAYIACVGERSVTYRDSGFPQTVEERAVGLRDLAHRFEFHADCIADVINGDAIVRVSDRDSRAFTSKAEIFDDAVHDALPNAQIIASESPLRANLNVWGAPPSALDKMRAIKARFDPNRTLNPGRFVDGI